MSFSVNAVAKGASRHINGEAPRFDQKNETFKRPFWDPSMADVKEKFYFSSVLPKKIPGYGLKEQAAVNASWLLDSKYGGGKDDSKGGLYEWEWDGKFDFPRVAKGLKIEETNPVSLTKGVKQMASVFGASLCGVCEVDKRWLYSSAFAGDKNGGRSTPINFPGNCKYAVVLAFEMDYELIRHSPALPASISVGLGYSRMAFTAGLLAQYIRGLGFQALPSGNDTACSIPLAIDAGLGELGRNGLLITPLHGPRVRLAKVFTDMPLITDRPIEFGVRDFCMVCEKCVDTCPGKSIMKGEPTGVPHNISNRKGTLKWNINAETCIRWWAASGCDCSNCIRTCPFNKPRGKLHDLVRIGINKLRKLNKLFLWADDKMGYGEKLKSEDFWD